MVNKKILIITLIAVFFVSLAAVLTIVIHNDNQDADTANQVQNSTNSTSTSPAIFISIFAAVFLPIIAANNPSTPVNNILYYCRICSGDKKVKFINAYLSAAFLSGNQYPILLSLVPVKVAKLTQEKVDDIAIVTATLKDEKVYRFHLVKKAGKGITGWAVDNIEGEEFGPNNL